VLDKQKNPLPKHTGPGTRPLPDLVSLRERG
jgi:hypothetical protein